LLIVHPRAAIVLAGDSAGAGLAHRDSGQAFVTAGGRCLKVHVAFSPYSEPRRPPGDSVEANARSCAMFTPRGIREAAAIIWRAADALMDPRASPCTATSRMPPNAIVEAQACAAQPIELSRAPDTLRRAGRTSTASRLGHDDQSTSTAACVEDGRC